MADEQSKNKFSQVIKEKWTGLSKLVRIIIICAVAFLIIAIIISSILNSKSKTRTDYIVLFKGMSSSETSEVVNILQSSNADFQMNTEGEITVPAEKWNEITISLAAKGYPKTTPTYGTFLDSLSMTMTDWEKRQAYIIQLTSRIEDTLRAMDGVRDATVTLNIAEKSQMVWDENQGKSTASVLLTLDGLSNFTNENVTAVKNIVSSATEIYDPGAVTVVNAGTGKTLLSTEEALGLDNADNTDKTGTGGVPSSLTLEQQAAQQNREFALEQATADVAEAGVREILEPLYGVGNVAATATYDLNYDNIINELTEYIPLKDDDGNILNNGTGIPTSEQVEYTIDKDLLVNDGGIVGEDENTDIPTYQNTADGDEVNSDNATDYSRKTYWALTQSLTQTEFAKGAVNEAHIAVTVLDSVNVILTEADKATYTNLVANATGIPVENVSFVSRYVAPSGGGDTTIPISTGEKFKLLIWRILPWLAGLAFLIIMLIIMLIAYGQRKTKREVRRAELESQAAIQSLQTTLDEHKRTLQDEVEAHQAETNSTANEVRDFVRENPEITAALIRAMLRNDN